MIDIGIIIITGVNRFNVAIECKKTFPRYTVAPIFTTKDLDNNLEISNTFLHNMSRKQFEKRWKRQTFQCAWSRADELYGVKPTYPENSIIVLPFQVALKWKKENLEDVLIVSIDERFNGFATEDSHLVDHLIDFRYLQSELHLLKGVFENDF